MAHLTIAGGFHHRRYDAEWRYSAFSEKKTYPRNIFENPRGYYEIHVELSIFDVIYQTKAFSILEMIVLTKSPNSEFPRGYFKIPRGFYKIQQELQNFNVTCQKKAF